MSYNALVSGTVSNKPYAAAQPVPTDARSYFYDEDLAVYRPFVSLTEAKNYLNTTNKRIGHFPVIVNSGGTLSSGVITGGTNEEYWWKDNTTDGGLVLKASGGGGVGSVEGGNID